MMLAHYFEFYNTERKHQSLGDQTPNRVYYEAVERMAAYDLPAIFRTS